MHISIVSPIYRAELIIPTLLQRIEQSLSSFTDNYEIILVDDGSPDDSWQVIEKFAAMNPRVVGVKLSRNFGQHPAIMAGLAHSNGDWVVVMDCDLQDQPEEIEGLYKKALEGYDLVLARRGNRKDSFLKRTTSKLFSVVLNYLSEVRLHEGVANFGIYSKKTIENILLIGDYVKSFPLFTYFVGFKSIIIDVEHAQRDSGKSNYSFSKLFTLAFSTIIAYSNKPLKLFVRLGITISLISFLIGIYYLWRSIEGKVTVSGYASIIVSLFFLSGVIISAIGIVGVYLGRVFEQTKNRPVYIVDRLLNR